MTPLSNDKLLFLYQCLLDNAEILYYTLEDVKYVFYCGKALKFSIPNALLIVVKTDEYNHYHEEMNTIRGCSGSSWISKYIDPNFGVWGGCNKSYHYKYRVITDDVFNRVATYNVIFDDDWVADDDPYRGGLSILDEMQRIDELLAFV